MASGNSERVAFCGLGIMGGPMAANLAISEGDGVGVQITTLTTVAKATMSMNSQ